MTSFHAEISARGAPKVTVSWDGKTGDAAQVAQALQDHLPIPLLAGVQNAVRLNGVDMASVPLKIRPDGKLDAHQLPQPASVLKLTDSPNTGLSVKIDAPSQEKSQRAFFREGLAHAWHVLSGKSGEENQTRQDLTTLRDQRPAAFLLAAGFKDPGAMSLKDLKEASRRVVTNKEFVARISVKEQQFAPVENKVDAVQTAREKDRGGFQKALGFAQAKGRDALEQFAVRPLLFIPTVVGHAISAVKNLVMTLVNGVRALTGSDAGVSGLKENATGAVKNLVSIFRPVAGAASWVLGWSPKDSGVHRMSEKLDNWAFRGAFIDDAELTRRFAPDPNAEFLIVNGITNNGSQLFDGASAVTYKEHQKKELVKRISEIGGNLQLTESLLAKAEKTDLLAVYTGNGLTDILLMAFESCGWSVASRKIVAPYTSLSYTGVYFHSAGGGIYKNYGDDIKATDRTFIGAAGMHDNWYKSAGTQIQNKFDIVPNLGPDTSGNTIGAKITAQFGTGKNIEIRQAHGGPGPLKLSKNHDFFDYFINDQIRK